MSWLYLLRARGKMKGQKLKKYQIERWQLSCSRCLTHHWNCGGDLVYLACPACVNLPVQRSSGQGVERYCVCPTLPPLMLQLPILRLHIKRLEERSRAERLKETNRLMHDRVAFSFFQTARPLLLFSHWEGFVLAGNICFHPSVHKGQNQPVCRVCPRKKSFHALTELLSVTSEYMIHAFKQRSSAFPLLSHRDTVSEQHSAGIYKSSLNLARTPSPRWPQPVHRVCRSPASQWLPWKQDISWAKAGENKGDKKLICSQFWGKKSISFSFVQYQVICLSSPINTLPTKYFCWTRNIWWLPIDSKTTLGIFF